MAERRPAAATRGSDPEAGAPTLVLAGHGSHLNADSSAPVRACADRLRDRRDGPVRTAFWKEEPSLRAVLRTVRTERAVVVPVMTSGGYFVDQVFPRELGLAEGRTASTPERPAWPDLDVAVSYAEPVGTHAALSDVVVQHAADVTDGAAPAPEFALALVGHGTERNENSARSTERHAERLREASAFGEVRALFMDEPPEVDDLRDHVDADRVVVVPLFVANGYHVTEDVPEDIGLPLDDAGDWPVPATVDGQQVWYADAVGTHPSLVEVVAARADEALARFEGPYAGDGRTAEPSAAERARRAFSAWVREADGRRRWGQLSVAADDDGYELRHVDDRGAPAPDLDALDGVDALRDRVRVDDADRYRPLSGAATLPTGWRLGGLDDGTLAAAVEAVYPTSVVDWHRERAGALQVTHYDAAAGRQTGIYADVDELDGAALEAAAAACCGGCTRRREWAAGEGEPRGAGGGEGAVPCPEPCSFLLAAAREFLALEDALAAGDVDEADRRVDHAVRPGDVDEPGNVYRARYLAARAGAGPGDLPAVDPAGDAAGEVSDP